MRSTIVLALSLVLAFFFFYDRSSADVKSVEVNSNNLIRSVEHVDTILSNITGVLIDNCDRGLTRAEHKRLDDEMHMIRVVVNTFMQQEIEKQKGANGNGEKAEAEVSSEGQ